MRGTLFRRGKVNWQGYVGGVSGAVGAGVSSFLTGIFGASLAMLPATSLASGLISNAAAQATGNLIGSQVGWDWRQFAVAGVSGLLGGVAGGLANRVGGNYIIKSGENAGRIDCGQTGKWLAVHVGGEVVGNVAGDVLDQTVSIWTGDRPRWDWGATLQAVGTGLVMGLATGYTELRANAACFSGDTHLRTLDGSRRIDELRVGDLVLSRNEHELDGPVAPRAVEEVFVRFQVQHPQRASWQKVETRACGEHPRILNKTSMFARRARWRTCFPSQRLHACAAPLPRT